MTQTAEFLLGQEIIDEMERKGFTCFDTKLMNSGESVAVFERHRGAGDAQRVEVGISHIICSDWFDDVDSPRWVAVLDDSRFNVIGLNLERWTHLMRYVKFF